MCKKQEQYDKEAKEFQELLDETPEELGKHMEYVLEQFEKNRKKMQGNACDECDREKGVEPHKLNADRMCEMHLSEIYGTIAEEWGYMV